MSSGIDVPMKPNPTSAPRLDLPRTTSDTSGLSKRKPLVVLESTCRLDSCQLPDFKLGKTLGTGSFGKVKHAHCLKMDEYFALKILKKSAVIRLKQVDHIISERTILRSISHPFIVSLQGSFQDQTSLYLILEYIPGGEFFSYLRRRGKLAAPEAMFYSAQIVSIFEYLHQFRIAYRDLKPENLLIDSKGYLRCTDFGFAKVVKTFTLTVCGTPEYISPEVLLNKGHTTSVDFWCLGIFLYEMLVGYPPFIGKDTMSTYQKIVAGKYSFPRNVDAAGKLLIKNLLQADLTKRFGNLRNGIDDIKNSSWFEGMDWEALFERTLPAPFIPQVTGSTDTSNFEEYPETTETVADPPLETNPFADW
jgi:protein kinase X